MISTTHFPKSSVPREFKFTPPNTPRTPASSPLFSPLESIPSVVSDGDSDSLSEASSEPSPKLKKQYSFKKESTSEFLSRQEKINELLRQETIKMPSVMNKKSNKDDVVVLEKKSERKCFQNKISIGFVTLPIVLTVFFTQFLLPRFLDHLPSMLRKNI